MSASAAQAEQGSKTQKMLAIGGAAASIANAAVNTPFPANLAAIAATIASLAPVLAMVKAGTIPKPTAAASVESVSSKSSNYNLGMQTSMFDTDATMELVDIMEDNGIAIDNLRTSTIELNDSFDKYISYSEAGAGALNLESILNQPTLDRPVELLGRYTQGTDVAWDALDFMRDTAGYYAGADGNLAAGMQAYVKPNWNLFSQGESGELARILGDTIVGGLSSSDLGGMVQVDFEKLLPKLVAEREAAAESGDTSQLVYFDKAISGINALIEGADYLNAATKSAGSQASSMAMQWANLTGISSNMITRTTTEFQAGVADLVQTYIEGGKDGQAALEAALQDQMIESLKQGIPAGFFETYIADELDQVGYANQLFAAITSIMANVKDVSLDDAANWADGLLNVMDPADIQSAMSDLKDIFEGGIPAWEKLATSFTSLGYSAKSTSDILAMSEDEYAVWAEGFFRSQMQAGKSLDSTVEAINLAGESIAELAEKEDAASSAIEEFEQSIVDLKNTLYDWNKGLAEIQIAMFSEFDIGNNPYQSAISLDQEQLQYFSDAARKEDDGTKALSYLQTAKEASESIYNTSISRIDNLYSGLIEAREKQIEAEAKLREEQQEGLEDTIEAQEELISKYEDSISAWESILDSIKAMQDDLTFSSKSTSSSLARLNEVNNQIAAIGQSWRSDPEQAERMLELLGTRMDLAAETFQRPSEEYQGLYDSTSGLLAEMEAQGIKNISDAERLLEQAKLAVAAAERQIKALEDIEEEDARLRELQTQWEQAKKAAAEKRLARLENLDRIFQEKIAPALEDKIYTDGFDKVRDAISELPKDIASEFITQFNKNGLVVGHDDYLDIIQAASSRTRTTKVEMPTTLGSYQTSVWADAYTRNSAPHASGLAYVPFDGYQATLHEGERVLTKEENNQRSKPIGDITIAPVITVNGNTDDNVADVIVEEIIRNIPVIKEQLAYA